MGGAPGPEAVRARKEVTLVNRLQQHQDRPPRQLVLERRDTERAFRAVPLEDVVPVHRRRAVAAGRSPSLARGISPRWRLRFISVAPVLCFDQDALAETDTGEGPFT